MSSWPAGAVQPLDAAERDRGAYLLRFVAPSLAHDSSFAVWFDRTFRHVGPGASRANTQMIFECDVRPVLPTIQSPTLVLFRSGDQVGGADHARYLADHIPGAKLVEFAGQDNLMYVGDSDAVVDETEAFLTGTRHAPETDRVLATVLFTDIVRSSIVRSTKRAAELGDERWRDLLDAHDQAIRR